MVAPPLALAPICRTPYDLVRYAIVQTDTLNKSVCPSNINCYAIAPNLSACNRRIYGRVVGLWSCLFSGRLLSLPLLRPSFLQYGTLKLGGLQFVSKGK